MALIVVELKQSQKQLETKNAEKAKVEQAGMTKTAESLTDNSRTWLRPSAWKCVVKL